MAHVSGGGSHPQFGAALSGRGQATWVSEVLTTFYKQGERHGRADRGPKDLETSERMAALASAQADALKHKLQGA